MITGGMAGGNGQHLHFNYSCQVHSCSEHTHSVNVRFAVPSLRTCLDSSVALVAVLLEQVLQCHLLGLLPRTHTAHGPQVC